MVDLDQTLIHTTNDQIPENIKVVALFLFEIAIALILQYFSNIVNILQDVFHFQLPGSNSSWYHTRLRPYTKEFLQEISQLYELHICTFGSRTYAHTIARFLDESGHYFSHRILSRDECFSSHSKTANLKYAAIDCKCQNLALKIYFLHRSLGLCFLVGITWLL